MNHSGFRPTNGSSTECSDARALPQFRLPGETVDPNDAAETLERPAVRLRPGRPTPQRMLSAHGLDGAPPPITAEVEARDILIETYAEPARPARSSAHAPPLAPSVHTVHTTLRSWSRSSLPPPNPPGPRLSRSSSSWNAVGRPPTVPPPSLPRRASSPSVPSVRPPAPPSRSSTPPPLSRLEREIEVFDVSSIGAPASRRREMDVLDI